MQQHQPRVSPDYDDDFYAWTQHQAGLLRALKNAVSKLAAGVDIDHLAEEIESLGSADLNAVKSFIRQILTHLIKVASEPGNKVEGHWRSEVFTFYVDIADRYTPSMRQLIDMQSIWRKALRGAELSLEEHGAQVASRIPAECPFEVDEFVGEDFDFDEALRKLGRT